MKATELMVRDKVLVKVLSQIPDTYVLHTWTAEDYMRDMLQVKPITLTAEILEKNGFISYQQDRIVIWRNDYSFAIECDLTTWEYYWANGDVKINYVHELQHALRLCGLNDLADNFKI